MLSFNHRVADLIGIHARPAHQIVKDAKKFESKITVRVGDKEIDCKNFDEFVKTQIKHSQELIVTVDGEDEEVAMAGMKVSFKNNL